jgi:AcrR family transcriptional regulator
MRPMRARIVAAAYQALRERGVRGATTREVARRAGVAEGSIYNHFEDKLALLVAVILESLPPLPATLAALGDKAGHASVRANLEEVARVALAFYGELLPLAGAILTEPELRERARARVLTHDLGPHRAHVALAGYLAAEQRLGRVDRGADPRVAALALLGACHEYAYVRALSGEATVPGPADRFAAETVRWLLAGLEPAGGTPAGDGNAAMGGPPDPPIAGSAGPAQPLEP